MVDRLSDELLRELQEVFNLFDNDNDGYLSFRELYKTINSLG